MRSSPIVSAVMPILAAAADARDGRIRIVLHTSSAGDRFMRCPQGVVGELYPAARMPAQNPH